MYYVDHDGAIVPSTFETVPSDVPGSRIFATLLGASRHADALPVTAINIRSDVTYDSREAMNNNWSLKGLKPNGVRVTITVEN